MLEVHDAPCVNLAHKFGVASWPVDTPDSPDKSQEYKMNYADSLCETAPEDSMLLRWHAAAASRLSRFCQQRIQASTDCWRTSGEAACTVVPPNLQQQISALKRCAELGLFQAALGFESKQIVCMTTAAQQHCL